MKVSDSSEKENLRIHAEISTEEPLALICLFPEELLQDDEEYAQLVAAQAAPETNSASRSVNPLSKDFVLRRRQPRGRGSASLESMLHGPRCGLQKVHALETCNAEQEPVRSHVQEVFDILRDRPGRRCQRHRYVIFHRKRGLVVFSDLLCRSRSLSVETRRLARHDDKMRRAALRDPGSAVSCGVLRDTNLRKSQNFRLQRVQRNVKKTCGLGGSLSAPGATLVVIRGDNNWHCVPARSRHEIHSQLLKRFE